MNEKEILLGILTMALVILGITITYLDYYSNEEIILEEGLECEYKAPTLNQGIHKKRIISPRPPELPEHNFKALNPAPELPQLNF